MLLKYLSKPEQELFLELCNFAANIDNDYSEQEKNYIQEYRQEMALDENAYTIKRLEYDEIVKKILEISTPESIRRIIIELIALLKSDGILHSQENNLIAKLQEDFKLSSDILKEIYESLENLENAYAKIFAIVNGN
ncbi:MULTISPECIES: hypothetical protein [Clostridia]|jgi:hypothetical protein|uniref:Tellurite resistance TerB n=1 Tax=Pseudobacteroides cellulosolvens ATCC 35603 = DSM 2933 TaxID=398512 RepID=A0A0L6JPL0_9FIRM|nr:MULTISPECIES: hypothetical protein [Clostridia]KNY27708.1 Tellurite resistance TerB [Pseudobacteroides cellulosolvens ATCC 35603 = DSM 2933]